MNGNGEHLGDDLELYALGMLEDEGRLRIEAHVVRCRDCAERLGRAENAVALLVVATLEPESAPAALRARVPSGSAGSVRSAPRRAFRWETLAALAAVIVCAIVAAGFAQQNAHLRTTVDADGATFYAMIDSHFSHTQFTTPAGAPLAAKVVYERHGRWFEVLAYSIDPTSRVTVVRAAGSTIVPTAFRQSGQVLTLALPAFPDARELRLIDRQGAVIGRAGLQVEGRAP